MACHVGGGRGVVDERGRQPQPGRRAQPLDQRDGAHGREPQLDEGALRVTPFVLLLAADLRRHGEHGLAQHALAFLRGEGGQPLAQRRGTQQARPFRYFMYVRHFGHFGCSGCSRRETEVGCGPRQPRHDRAARDLAGRRTRHGGDLVDLRGHLVVGQQGPASPQHTLGVEPTATGHDEGDRDLAEDVVRGAHDDCVGHSGAAEQGLFDLGGVDVLAAGDDQFADPAGEGEMAVLDPAGQVPGAVPAVLERGGGRLELVVVAGHEPGSAHPHLALVTVRDVLPGAGIDEPYVHTGRRKPARAVDPGPVRPVHGDHPAGLGAAVRVQQGCPEHLLDGPGERRRTRRARDDTVPQPGARGPGGLPGRRHQPVVGRGDTGHQRERTTGPLVHPMRLVEYAQQPTGRQEFPGDVGARAGGDDTQYGERVPEAVEQRERPEQPVPGREPEDRRVAGLRRPEGGALRGHNSLGPVGGSGGVEQPRRLVESEIVPRRSGALVRNRRIEEHGPVGGLRGHRPRPGDQHPQTAELLAQPRQLAKVRPIRDDHRGATVRQQVLEFRIGGAGIQQDTDPTRPRHRETTLHQLDAVAQQDRHPVTPAEPRPRQVTGQLPCAPLQFPVRHTTRGVREGDPVARPRGMPLQQLRQRPNQFVVVHHAPPRTVPEPFSPAEASLRLTEHKIERTGARTAGVSPFLGEVPAVLPGENLPPNYPENSTAVGRREAAIAESTSVSGRSRYV